MRRLRGIAPFSVIAVLLLVLGVAAACQPAAGPDDEAVTEEPEPAAEEAEAMAAVEVAKSGGGTATLPLDSPEEMDRLQGHGITPAPTLTITVPEDGAILEEPNLEVGYEMENYDVGQGPDRPNQHVHVIVDDMPYKADYDPTGSVAFGTDELEPGSHVLTTFLAREMHLSLKSPGASDQVVFHVGEPTEDWAYEKGAPTLVYSRPKGEYSRADGSADHIMLDFYLFNAELGPDSYKVRATVDGDEPFLITDWSPRVILRQPELGEHTVRLELVDAEGEPVPGPTNDTTRTISIVE